MPSAKLTLRLDKEVIELGKRFAREQGTSLSRMVESYILQNVAPPLPPKDRIIREPDPELMALFPPRPPGSFELKSPADLRDEYYTDLRNRPKVEEE